MCGKRRKSKTNIQKRWEEEARYKSEVHANTTNNMICSYPWSGTASTSITRQRHDDIGLVSTSNFPANTHSLKSFICSILRASRIVYVLTDEPFDTRLDSYCFGKAISIILSWTWLNRRSDMCSIRYTVYLLWIWMECCCAWLWRVGEEDSFVIVWLW